MANGRRREKMREKMAVFNAYLENKEANKALTGTIALGVLAVGLGLKFLFASDKEIITQPVSDTPTRIQQPYDFGFQPDTPKVTVPFRAVR